MKKNHLFCYSSENTCGKKISSGSYTDSFRCLSFLIKRILTVLLIINGLSACLTTQATVETIEKAYNEKDLAYFEKIYRETIKVNAPELKKKVIEYYKILFNQQADTTINQAIRNNDYPLLKSFREDDILPLLSNALREKIDNSIQTVKFNYEQKEIEQYRIDEQVKQAFKDENITWLEQIVQNPDGLLREKTQNDIINYLKVKNNPDMQIKKLKEQNLDKKAQKVPSVIQNNVFNNPEEYLSLLVNYLMKDEWNPYLKIKLIHDWIANYIRYDADAYFNPSKRGSQQTYDLLKTRICVCEGFANLFLDMTKLAGFKTEKITGLSKGTNYSQTGKMDYHAWNAVRIFGQWYCLDITWDASYIDNNEKKAYKQYSTGYLLTKPEDFIYLHYPDQDEYQYLAEPVSKNQFDEMLLLNPDFFKYNLKLLTPNLKNEMEVNDIVQIDLECPLNVFLFGGIIGTDKDFHPELLFFQKDQNIYHFYFTFDHTGRYNLGIYAYYTGKKYKLTHVLELPVINQNPDIKQKTYPALYLNYNKFKAELISPLEGDLLTGKEYEFIIKLPKGYEAALCDKKIISYIPYDKKDNLYKIKYTFNKPGNYYLAVNEKLFNNDSLFLYILRYNVKQNEK